MAFGTAWGIDGGTYDGKEMRELVGALSGGTAGVVGTDDLKVQQQAAATNTVRVAAGHAVVSAPGVTEKWAIANDAFVNSPTIAATASGVERRDRVIVRVVAGVPTIQVVQGTAAAPPAAEPAITGTDFLELALIVVPASTTNITDAMITDRRVRTGGGVYPVTSTTRPATPFDGQYIYEKDTDRLYFWTGTAWSYVAGGNDPTAARAFLTSTTLGIVAGAAAPGTRVTYDTESYDYGNNMAAGLYTAPRTGLVDIKARASLAGVIAAQRMFLSAAVAGVEASRGDDVISHSSGSLSSMIADTLAVTAGQTVGIHVQLSGNNRFVEAGSAVSFFSARMLP